jgi:hypothetical protein
VTDDEQAEALDVIFSIQRKAEDYLDQAGDAAGWGHGGVPPGRGRRLPAGRPGPPPRRRPPRPAHRARDHHDHQEGTHGATGGRMTTMGTAEWLTGFEEALAQAHAEGNMTRATVTRQVTTTTTITTVGGHRATSRRGGRRTLADTLLHCVIALQGTTERLVLELEGGLDTSVTPGLADDWVDDLTEVIRPLRRLRAQLRDKARDDRGST